MDRVIIYPGQVPLETDLLQTNKFAMVALSKLSAAVLGTGTLVNGFSVVPTGPASLSVNVNPGEIYSLQNIDGTPYSSIAADTTHSIVKQGISLDVKNLACAAPGSVGQSINYLVQATYTDSDSGSIVLPYYNASNPAVAYSGPGGNGVAQNTLRQGVVTLNAKAGIAAATGSQVTPAADAGYVGLYVVTVANGQTTITSGNISTFAGAPIITERLGDKVGTASVVTAASDPTFASNTTAPASTGWVRSAMGAIATAAGFVFSAGANGYIKFPSWLGAWIVQWGLSPNIGQNASGTITFPIAFPTAVYRVFLTDYATASNIAAWRTDDPTLTNSPVANQSVVGSSVNRACFFLVIGK